MPLTPAQLRSAFAAAARARVSAPAKPGSKARPAGAVPAATKPKAAPQPKAKPKAKPKAVSKPKPPEQLTAPVSAGAVFEVLCARAKAADPVSRRAEVAARYPELRAEYRSDEIARRSACTRLGVHEEKTMPIASLVADQVERGHTLCAARDRVAAARPDLASAYRALVRSRLPVA